MQLTHLSLTNFRNYKRLDIDIPSGSILLIGDNAQGKTSLLEAVYYLATFTSFQASHDRQLINFISLNEKFPVARIVAHFNRTENEVNDQGSELLEPKLSPISPGDHLIEIRLILQPTNSDRSYTFRKELLLDGVKCKAIEAVGAFNAVLFLPQMLTIIEGSPEHRRRYLNLLLVQIIPNYGNTLTEYNRCLTQRNALLKRLQEKGGDKNQLDYWDNSISMYGARLIHARIHSLLALEREASLTHHELSNGNEILRLIYQPSYDPLPINPNQIELPINVGLDRSGLSLEKIQKGYLENLQAVRREEISRGTTTIGPHRDEFRIYGNGIDLGTYGSRGQARTAVLSLKLAEVSWMRHKTGQWPVLLLDEVLAELDPNRRYDFLDKLTTSDQTLLTTTDLDLFSKKFIQSATHWKVESGRLMEIKNES